MKAMIVVGNGFDLDCGYSTSYRDFISSLYWPLSNPQMGPYENSPLAKFVKNKVAENWSDVEDMLYQYIKTQQIDTSYAEHDKVFFDDLKNQLSRFLDHIFTCHTSFPKFSGKVMKWMKQFNIKNIYSFNYTRLDGRINQYLNENFIQEEDIKYIHGKNYKRKIILGIREITDSPIPSGYEFLYKSFDENYKSHDLTTDLPTMDVVIFFGLSFGYIDNIYFEDFFKSIGKHKDKKPIIVIVSKDKDSLNAIKKNILKMGVSIQELHSYAYTYFIPTDSYNTQENINTIEQQLIKLSKQ